jgi:hypothetical protein
MLGAKNCAQQVISCDLLLSPLFYWHIFGHLWADIFGAGADQAVIGVLLENVSCPARYAATGKNGRIHIDGKAHHIVDRGRVEIYVAIESLMLLDVAFDDARHLKPAAISGAFS